MYYDMNISFIFPLLPFFFCKAILAMSKKSLNGLAGSQQCNEVENGLTSRPSPVLGTSTVDEMVQQMKELIVENNELKGEKLTFLLHFRHCPEFVLWLKNARSPLAATWISQFARAEQTCMALNVEPVEKSIWEAWTAPSELFPPFFMCRTNNEGWSSTCKAFLLLLGVDREPYDCCDVLQSLGKVTFWATIPQILLLSWPLGHSGCSTSRLVHVRSNPVVLPDWKVQPPEHCCSPGNVWMCL